jgi:amino acid transporter
MIMGGNIESLIDFFSFTVWIFYGMSMLALLVLRKNKPDIARPYKVRFFVNILYLVISGVIFINM